MKMVMIGDPKAGKTTIAQTLFQRIGQKYVIPLTHGNADVYDLKINDIQFLLYDFPAKWDLIKKKSKEVDILCQSSALIYVIDSQADPKQSLTQFINIYKQVKKYIPQKCHFFIFTNKADISYNSREDKNQMIKSQKRFLSRKNIDLKDIQFNFTSVLDYTIYQAFSRVIQTILPFTQCINKFLNSVAQKSRLENILVCDAVTKLVIGYNNEIELTAKFYDIYSEMAQIQIGINNFAPKTISKPKEAPKKDRVQLKLGENGNGNGKKQIFIFQQIQESLFFCYSINEMHYDRIFILDQNINAASHGVQRCFNVLKNFMKEQ